MTESPQSRARRRWISFGETIAVAALIISALGLWLTWRASQEDKPTRIVEQRQPIALTLRGKVERDGRQLVIAPVEDSHALQSLAVTVKGSDPIDLGSEGRLEAGTVAGKLAGKALDKGNHSVGLKVTARYVEMGKDRSSSGTYVLRYRVEGGGLFGGRSVKLEGFSR